MNINYLPVVLVGQHCSILMVLFVCNFVQTDMLHFWGVGYQILFQLAQSGLIDSVD